MFKIKCLWQIPFELEMEVPEGSLAGILRFNQAGINSVDDQFGG